MHRTLLTISTCAAVTKEDIQTHFKDGTGNITEVKLMNGFGFIEYDDAMDARDVVPGKLIRSWTKDCPLTFTLAFRTVKSFTLGPSNILI